MIPEGTVLAARAEVGPALIAGAAGTGKTCELLRRALACAASAPEDGVVLVTAPSDAGVARLRARLAAANAPAGIACASLGDVALALLRAASPKAGLEAIDDARAARHFEAAGAQLFSLEWTELVTAEIDPEVTGLRAPERFSAAAFRLIRKLRASLVSPEEFKLLGLRGATKFYGSPPNLASPELLLDTQAKYRDSLRVSPAELARQRAREVDLVKVLARLYASYVETLVAHGCLTATDAVYEAALALRARPDLRAAARTRYRALFVDDAQDVTAGGLALLAGIARGDSANLTLAGDDAQSTRGFATGARGVETLKGAATTTLLTQPHRSAPRIVRAARALLPDRFPPETADGADDTGAVAFYRADTPRDEARYVADEVARLLAGGTPPREIAVITRNLRCAHAYVDALLARDVPVDVGGAASLYDFPATRDALAALWPAVDPFRHDYLLRALQAPWLGLCDASVATLCSEPTDGQPLLFELEGEPADARLRRWDRRRNLRLGRNVTRGDVDRDLPPETRARLEAFRAALARYGRAARCLEPPELARLVLSETILATASGDARGRFTGALVARLQREIDAYFAREPLASLEEYLTFAEVVAITEDDLLSVAPVLENTVRVLDVEAAKGESFSAVFVVDVRAGAWPRYYVPDAFLFMPSAGMIPKENVGDAASARTAKFTYSLYRFRLREKYNAQERRALYCALTRARDYISMSVSGRATRGASTPELFEELRAKLER